MIVALYILIALLVVGAILYAMHRNDPDNASATASEEAEAAVGEDEPEECCGLHATCEKDSLISAVSTEIVYYDDEELDRFRGRSSIDYSDSEIEEFRNVLLTLLPDDIAGWGRSIQLRGITLPEDVRDELIMIVRENRLTI